MPPKRKHHPKPTLIARAQPWIISVALIILPAAASCISQLTLAPSFGAIPSAVNHQSAILLTFTLGLLLQRGLPNLNRQTAIALLGVWIFYIPAIQTYILPYHNALGPIRGPILQGALSCHSIIIPSAAILGSQIEALAIQNRVTKQIGLVLGGFVALLSFGTLERWITTSLPRLLSYFPTKTPVHLQALLATAYIVLNGNSKRRLVLLAIPAILHIAALNPHCTNTGINLILSTHGWFLLERQWSETGYISVLQGRDKGYRIMRADHSLLGGEWLLTPERAQRQNWKTAEPIYAVFQLLEAVRLVEISPATPDPGASALVIGLGIGTTPAALISHGIDTTILELDPAVHRLARDYFSLPPNHTFVRTDAVPWVLSASRRTTMRAYTYIIHDVFTGGAEPLPLFTRAFLAGLRRLLAADGVIALNYAGELGSPLTDLVLRTIVRVFDGRCRAFRDSPRPSARKGPGVPAGKGGADSPGDSGDDGEEEGGGGGGEDPVSDFVNLVVFCRNSPGPITFRPPREADFLGSLSRRTYLSPPPGQEVGLPLVKGEDSGDGDGDGEVLTEDGVGRWRATQVESARRHWRIMRGVVGPDVVWDLW